MRALGTRIACMLALLTSLTATAQVGGSPQSTGVNGGTDVTGANAPEQGRIMAPKGETEPQLPDAPSDQVRLTAKQKFDTFVKRTYSPSTIASAAFSATWAQATSGWYAYGGGVPGWGKRFGASFANVETRMMFSSFLLPVAFRQDPRYHPSNKRGLLPRAWYAGTRLVVTRGDDGDSMFNYSEVLGLLFTSSVQNAYYPERDRSFGQTMQRFAGGFVTDATSNLLREFSPELKRAALKLIPKRARKLEQKVPDSVEHLGGQLIMP